MLAAASREYSLDWILLLIIPYEQICSSASGQSNLRWQGLQVRNPRLGKPGQYWFVSLQHTYLISLSLSIYIYIKFIYEICEAFAYTRKRRALPVGIEYASICRIDQKYVRTSAMCPRSQRHAESLAFWLPRSYPAPLKQYHHRPAHGNFEGIFSGGWGSGVWHLFVFFFHVCCVCFAGLVFWEQGLWNMVGFGCFFHFISWLAWGERRVERRTWHDLCCFFQFLSEHDDWLSMMISE